MDTDLTQMLTELGVLVEDTGRTLQSDTPLSDEELTELRRTLIHCSGNIQKIRYTNFNRN